MSTKIIARREKPPIVGTSSYLALQYHAGHVGSGAGGDLVQNCVLFACKPHPYPLKWNDSIAWRTNKKPPQARSRSYKSNVV